jgi:putative phosphoesterase
MMPLPFDDASNGLHFEIVSKGKRRRKPVPIARGDKPVRLHPVRRECILNEHYKAKANHMRIGIISDTHDRLERTIAAVELLRAEGAEALIHCGDLTGVEIVAVCSLRPCYFVFGNNDADNVPALRAAIEEAAGVCLGWGGEVTLAGKRIAVTHGHMNKDIRQLLAARPDYLFSGHSHVASDSRTGSTRRINPGALHRATEYTVAILDLMTDDLRFLSVQSDPKWRGTR